PNVALAFLVDQHVTEGQRAVAREVDVAKAVGLENPGALGTDVDSRRHRVSLIDLAADLPESRHGGPDLAWLAQGADLDHEGLFPIAELELDDQIGVLIADARPSRLLPPRRGGKELLEALSRLPPDVFGFEHVSLAPSSSASAETIRTIE